MSSISGTVTQTVVLGTPHYHSPLTIHGTGAIEPVTAGADGIDVPASVVGGVIINEGVVQAAAGGGGVHRGGIGIDLLAAANVTNSGTVAGGNAISYSYGRVGGKGGIGVSMSAGGSLANSGLIGGGTGGGNVRGQGGNGGDAVLLAHGTLSNTGTIKGGSASNYNGPRVSGNGGNGVDLRAGSNASNGGLIMGGGGTYDGGSGGIGVDISHSSLSNTGTIVGGTGGGAYYRNGGAGGVGVLVGAHGYLSAGGVIKGGEGNYGHFNGGQGGTGIVISDATVMAAGAISGGVGGQGGESYGGTGGTGVFIENGGKLTLTGSIAAGAAGRSAFGEPTYGGVGVIINGGTLIDSGAISGTAGTYGMADAVVFTGAGTLTVEAGASFTGDVVGTTGAELILGGAASGTLTGLGSSIYGFNNVAVARGSDWTLAGNVSGSETITLDSHATLTAAGGLAAAQLSFAGPAELVVNDLAATTSLLAGFGMGDNIDVTGVKATALDYSDGTLTLLSADGTLGTLDFSGSYMQSNFVLGSDHNGGTLVRYSDGTAAAFTPPHEPGAAYFGFNFHHVIG